MRRALVAGIDHYQTAADLAGCVNDANTVEKLLETNADGSPNFSVRAITSAPGSFVRRIDLRAAIDALFKQEADLAVLYFSGHGTENNLGGYLVTSDAERYDEGVGLQDVLTLANSSSVRQAVIIIDSCHSGHLGEIPALANDQAHLREGISVLTASRSNEAALESGGAGIFTALVCAALDGGAADVLGNVTPASIYSYVDESLGPWEQRPLFKAHVSKLASLRQAAAPIPVEVVRRLPEWFPAADSVFALDPSYEPEADPKDDDHQEVFACLQKCVRVRLVEPVGAQHMYFAAMNSTGCRLTALGRHYWLRAKKGYL